jgi:threonine 3-dehydrogenase
VTGVGTIGLMAVSIARAAGAGTILVTDANPKRLELAKELGADHAFEAQDPSWPAEARRLTHGQGPQVLLEMSGHPTALHDGFRALRNGGTAALLGLPPGPISLNLAEDVIFKGATVLGINGRLMFETWYQVESFLLAGRIHLEQIITHEIDLVDFDRGIAMMQWGDAIKVVMRVPHDEVPNGPKERGRSRSDAQSNLPVQN